MSYSTSPFNPDKRYKGQVKSELKQADDNFNILAQAFKNNDPTTGIVNHASVADSCNNCGGSSDNNFGVVPGGFDSWIDENIAGNIGFPQFLIQDTAPSYDANHATFWYNTNNNTVNIITKEGYNVPIDWSILPKGDLWYGIGKLKIENNLIKISNDGNNWITAYTNVISAVNLIADDSKSGDDFKIVYLYGDNTFQQSLERDSGSFTKTRISCVSPSSWQITIQQNDNQNTAGWIGLHLGDIDISDGQGSEVSKSDSFDNTGYSDISNAKFLPLGWMPVRDSSQDGYYTCEATLTITVDNHIDVSSKVYKPNQSGYEATFTCSGTLPSSANHFGSFVLNGDSYTTPFYTVKRVLSKLTARG